MMLTKRERFLQALHFGNPDKIPLAPGGPRESTLEPIWYSVKIKTRAGFNAHHKSNT